MRSSHVLLSFSLITRFFDSFSEPDYARSGFIATETRVLPQGPLTLDFSLEPRLRQLGLPTVLKDGVIQLLGDFTVCKDGEKITPEQGKLLVPLILHHSHPSSSHCQKLLDIKLSEFALHPVCYWGPDGEFEQYIEN